MLKTVSIYGYIYLVAGLRIGGNKDTMQIGGIDSPVIKNPLNNMPYIPGSSIKGKTRSLLESYIGLENSSKPGEIPSLHDKPKNEKFTDWQFNKISVLFGHLEHRSDNPSYPTRVIFRDSGVLGVINYGEEIIEANIDRNIVDIVNRTSTLFSEAKMEVAIDRLSGTVGGCGPRTLERVPAGTVFSFNIILRVFKEEEEKEHLDLLLKGLKLLERDALGGSGSRGYGRIKIFGLKLDGNPIDLNNVEL